MIIINKLSKNYGKIVALDTIALKIGSQKLFGLVGPNGAGKSTLINILIGLLKKDNGEVNIVGYNLEKDTLKIKKIIGVMPEVLALFERLTGEEQLSFVANIYNLEASVYQPRIKDILQYLELYTAKDRQIEAYSQGMKKKIAFAAAIIHTPQILFLDEPFENVDPISRKKMKDVLKRMKEKGSTVFITSHALAEIEDFCDEVAIINKGKIVYQSETKDIRNKIKNDVTKETYQSLEDIFIDLTIDKEENDKTLSWI
jgi:ABC-2 type transport system ATP-binding protein